MQKAVLSLFLGGILGKVLGVFRELLLAALFGTTVIADAYRAAQTATLIPTNFFTTDALNAGFIPLYNLYKTENPEKGSTLFGTLNVVLGGVSVLVSLSLFLLAESWAKSLVPGFGPDAFSMTVNLIRVMAIGVPFYVQSSLFCYLEIGNGGYSLASLQASIQSVGLIAGTIIAFWQHNLLWLAWGFTGAYIAFTAISGWLLWKRDYSMWPSQWLWPETQMILSEFWKVMKPLLLLPILLQGNIAAERIVASFLGVGVVASLEYAKIITETGVVLIGVPLGMACLAELSKISITEARNLLNKWLPPLLIILVPLSAFIALNAQGIVSLLFARGKFNAQSVEITSAILLGLSFGFWAQIISYMLMKALNAQLRNREVMIFAAFALVLNTMTNIISYRYLGPLALGVGSSIYGLTLLFLSTRALNISNVLLRTLLPLTLGLILYMPVQLFIIKPGALGLIQSVGFTALFWVTLVVTIPSLRQPLSTALVKFNIVKKIS